MCQIWLRSDGRVEKGGGGGTDRQTDRPTDKGNPQLYIIYFNIMIFHQNVVSSRSGKVHQNVEI